MQKNYVPVEVGVEVKAGGGGNGGRMSADFDVTYTDGRKFILLKADLAKGWRRLTKTFGFSRQMWIYYPGDFKVRTALTLLASPSTFDQSSGVSQCFAQRRH